MSRVRGAGRALVLVAVSVLMATACQPDQPTKPLAVRTVRACCTAPTPNPGPTTAPPADGTTRYSGNGQSVSQIWFDSDGSVVTNLHGNMLYGCAFSAQRGDQYQPFIVPEPVTVGSDGSFSDTVSMPGPPSGSLTVTGSLVDGGTATGTVHFEGTTCATHDQAWTAAVPGVEQPPVPTFSASPTDACSPQPCSVLGGVSLVVTGEATATLAQDQAEQVLVVDVTLDNQGTVAQAPSAAQSFQLAVGDGSAHYPTFLPAVTSDGQQHSCQPWTLQPFAVGQSASEEMCFPTPDGPITGSLTLTWQMGGAGTGTIDLPPPQS